MTGCGINIIKFDQTLLVRIVNEAVVFSGLYRVVSALNSPNVKHDLTIHQLTFTTTCTKYHCMQFPLANLLLYVHVYTVYMCVYACTCTYVHVHDIVHVYVTCICT